MWNTIANKVTPKGLQSSKAKHIGLRAALAIIVLALFSERLRFEPFCKVLCFPMHIFQQN